MSEPLPVQSPSSGMHIHWIAEGVRGSDEGVYRSNLASNRYRAALPAGWLSSNGHRVHFIDQHRWMVDAGDLPDAVVVAKLPPFGGDAQMRKRIGEHVLGQIDAARRQGVAVLADFNDDHFDHPTLGLYWRCLASGVDICVVGSDAMGAAVRRHTDRPVRVIGDPIGSPRGEPRVFRSPTGLSRIIGGLLSSRGAKRLQLVWYGDGQNWPAMRDWAEQIVSISEEFPFILWVVTRPQEAIEAQVIKFNRQYGPRASMELVPWDEETQWSVVRDADVVLIPADLTDPTKAVKTSNRLTDALHAGRYVIASPLVAYKPFAEFVMLTDTPLSALRGHLQRPEAALRALTLGQGAAIASCSLGTIGHAWQAALTEAVAIGDKPATGGRTSQYLPVPHTEIPLPQRAPVRLNLGCGDKILAGYLNVDVVAARAGQTPDVLCDLHDLSVFESSFADEILAVHVVEHFWRWEIEAILCEWLRVLKPGGQMILECPNLISACEAFLKDPERAALPTKEGQRTMWVFYGDPAWKDPYMIHRWGYTPESLKRLMESVGFINVRQEPAQFKLREPRDMRVVGEKPLA